ncbi:hypothetical protein Efla_003326 [Eimeria flavescens]
MEDFSGTSSRLAELMWSAVRECESRRTQLEREGLKKAYLLAAKEDLDAEASRSSQYGLKSEMHDEELRLEQVVKDVAETDKELAQHAVRDEEVDGSLDRLDEGKRKKKKQVRPAASSQTSTSLSLPLRLQELQAKPTRGEEEKPTVRRPDKHSSRQEITEEDEDQQASPSPS